MDIYDPSRPLQDQRLLVGREQETEQLRRFISDDSASVAAIVGTTRCGKTSLWKSCLDQSDMPPPDKVQIFNYMRKEVSRWVVQKDIDLIIIDDLSFESVKQHTSILRKFIFAHKHCHILLVGTEFEAIQNLTPALTIRIPELTKTSSRDLILLSLRQATPEAEISRVINFTKGNPFLINLIAHHVSRGRTIREAIELITMEIDYKLGEKIEISTSVESRQLITNIRTINESLLERVRKNPSAMHTMTSRHFEEMVAELMLKMGYCVDLTKATRDGGKDLIVANHSDLGNFIFYVECKKNAPHRPVGVEIVRQLAGTIYADRVTAGIIITSSYFSPEAVSLSKTIKHQINLVDYIKLNEWIQKNC